MYFVWKAKRIYWIAKWTWMSCCNFPSRASVFLSVCWTMEGTPQSNSSAVSVATRRDMRLVMNTRVCERPTRMEVVYFKASGTNAVNNVGIIGRSAHKVEKRWKMWACEHHRGPSSTKRHFFRNFLRVCGASITTNCIETCSNNGIFRNSETACGPCVMWFSGCTYISSSYEPAVTTFMLFTEDARSMFLGRKL